MNRDTRSRLIWKAVPTLFDFPELSDLVCIKRRGATSVSNACSKRSLDESSIGLNLVHNNSKSIFGKVGLFEKLFVICNFLADLESSPR